MQFKINYNIENKLKNSNQIIEKLFKNKIDILKFELHLFKHSQFDIVQKVIYDGASSTKYTYLMILNIIRNIFIKKNIFNNALNTFLIIGLISIIESAELEYEKFKKNKTRMSQSSIPKKDLNEYIYRYLEKNNIKLSPKCNIEYIIKTLSELNINELIIYILYNSTINNILYKYKFDEFIKKIQSNINLNNYQFTPLNNKKWLPCRK